MPYCWKKTTFLFVSLLFLFNSSAFALTCNPIYASKYNGSTGAYYSQLYTLTNNAAALAGTASQNLAAISQATDTNIYFDNGANTIIRKYTGSATSNLGTNWLSWTGSSGPGGAFDGNSYYVGANYHLYQVTTAGAITDKGALVPTSGDTIYSSLKVGDVAADNNGRLYWYASVNGTGTSYLYRIDVNTLKATNLGNYGPNAASGAAFNNAGALISTSGSPSSVYSMDLGANSSTNLGTVTGFAANELVYDLASCNLPTLDPNLAIAKSVANITTSQSPATLALANDVLEYTITVTNNGNLAADTTTLSDTIPTGTTYVTGSTTLNGAAISDVSGKMPYDPTGTGTREIHSSGQAAGVVQVGAAKAVVVKFRVKLNASGLPASISNTATTNYPKVTGGATTFVNVTSNSSDVSTSGLPKLTGVVFEDVNYGGGAGRPFSTAGAVGVSGVRVELYGTAGNFISSTTTATDGSYSFSTLAAGNYYVRVVNNTIKSTRVGSNATERGVQTYRTDGTTATTNEVGGRNPAVVDATSNTTSDTLNTSTFLLSGGGQAQSVQPITLAASDRTGINFGFNFDTIVNTNDSGQGSLRQFILNSNLLQNTGLAQTGLTLGVETSIFQLTGTAPFTITPIASLPAITDSYTAIDATTQSGTNCAASGRNLVVQLDGTNSGANAQGLTVNADHTLIRGLAIGNYTESGIYASSTGTNLTVQCNNLGLKTDGSTLMKNTFYGLYDNGGANLTLGGITSSDRNIISGNGKDGARLYGVNTALIQNNYIGTSATGLSALSNNQETADYAGIMLTGASLAAGSKSITIKDNVIAGNDKGVANTANTSKGIKAVNASLISITNNRIGTTPDGMTALLNTGYGIYTQSATDITIGGTTAAERNIISGNQQDGINTRFGTNRITIYGNYIGLGSDGVKAIGNANNGIFLADTSNALIGNGSASGRNIIANNSLSGIRNSTSNATKIADNFLGTDVSGTLDKGNTLHGIYVQNSNDVVVGGSINSDANLIIYNKVIGVFTERLLASTANTNTLIENNYIGILKDGETIAGNTQAGIETKNNTGVTVRNNTISGNKTRGVHVVSSPSTTITNNRIGTNAAGTSDKGNLQYGIDINTAAANLTINGNTISGNDMAGIRLINGDATASAIADNRIGTNLSGTADLPNTLDGIIVDNTPNVFIGSSSGVANTISGNTRNGILINGTASQSIQILGNLIGLNSAGTSSLANTGEGILVQASASNINIGDGTSTGANKIAYNGGNGISLSGTTPSNVTISHNSLYANQALGIDLGLDQVSLDDTNDADSGANNLLNFPIFKTSQIIGSNLVVSGCAPAGAKIELFEADVSPSSSAGQPAGANQTTLTQDYGEGEAYLTSYTEGVGEDPVSFSCSSLINADGNSSTGMSEFQWTLPLPSSLVLGDKITATATLSGTGTSEFSAISTLANPAYDYSDAPVTYGSPSHEIVAGVYLGTTAPDSETTAQPNATATGDDTTGIDDEGGLILNNDTSQLLLLAHTNQTVNNTLTVTPSSAGYLNAWLDADQNGTFEATEQIFNDQAVVAGAQNLSFTLPSTIKPGLSYLRVRFTTGAGQANTPTGLAPNGEVEDYQVKVRRDAAPLSCSASPTVIYTSLDLGHFERVNSTTHWMRNTGVLPNGTVVDVRVTANAAVTAWDMGQTAPGDPILNVRVPNTQTRLITVNFFEAGTLNPVTGNFILNVGDIDGDNPDVSPADGVGDDYPLMPKTTYSADGESYEVTTFQAFELDTTTRLYQTAASNPPTLLAVKAAATNNYDASILAKQLVVRVAWENVSSLQYTYYAGQFGGTDVDLQAFNTSGMTSSCETYDSSDAPATYGNPTHAIVSGIYLGTNTPDNENAPPSPLDGTGDDITGNDDEDGVTLPALTQGQTTTITATVVGAGGYLQGWIDWNGNGVFDASEQVATNVQDNLVGDTNNTLGTIAFTVNVPATSVTTKTYARFRWSTTINLNATTATVNGEVEDYALTVSAATPFVCDANLYQSVAEPTANDPTRLVKLVFSSSGVTASAIGSNSHGIAYNAIGYNVLDNYLYGIKRTATGDTLVRIDATGTVLEMGLLSLALGGQPGAGDMDDQGNLYVKVAGQNNLFKINVATRTVTSIPSSLIAGFVVADFAWNKLDGMMYGVGSNNGLLYSLNPTTGAITTIGNTAPVTIFGAQFFDNAGNLYGIENATGNLYRFNISDGSNVLVAKGVSPAAGNDGASCRGSTPVPLGTIAGSVYVDTNVSNSFDSGIETGISNVTVKLYFDNGTPSDTADDTLITTMSTAANGAYQFQNINASTGVTYRVEVDTADPDLGAMVIGTPNPLTGLTVTAGATTTADFGFDLFVDYGDAPSTYGTPKHTIVPGVYLGMNAPDSENTPPPPLDGTGDDTTDTADEEGIILPSMMQGQTTTITATVTGINGYLQGWIDWDGNGTFDPSEQIATNLQDNVTGDTDSTAGKIAFNLNVPATAITTKTYARFRWSTTKDLNATATANDGEVEDYSLTITAYHQLFHPVLGLTNSICKVSPTTNAWQDAAFAWRHNECWGYFRRWYDWPTDLSLLRL